MSDSDSSLSLDQISSLFPQLENIQLIGTKGPQHIFTATLKSNFAPVILRAVPTTEADIFGWTPEFLIHSRIIIEQTHPGMLRVYEAGQSGPLTFIISEHSPYPRLEHTDPLPQVTPQIALNVVRNMAEGLLSLHRKGVFHGGITPKLIVLSPNGNIAQLLPINIYPAQSPVDMGEFASPEWVTGAADTFTAGMDIYALGLTLYILLTRKTPMEAGFAMPSTQIKCSDAVDTVVAKAINPNTRERYHDLSDFITDLDHAIARPTARNAGVPASPLAVGLPIPSLNSGKGQVNIYYYLIPALIVGIVLTYTCILYKQDVAKMRTDINEKVQKDNEAKANVVRQANKANKTRHTVPAPAPIIPPTTTVKDTDSTKTPPAIIPPVTADKEIPTTPETPATPGEVNWSQQPGVKVRQSSNRNMLDAYGPEKAVDGNTSSALGDVSISATGVTEDKNAWFGIDFGKETNRPVSKIVIYTPSDLTLLGTMEEFKVMLYDNEKQVLAEKTFTTSPGSKGSNISNWALESPIKVRALRIESTSPQRPVALTEVEVYGPQEDMPAETSTPQEE